MVQTGRGLMMSTSVEEKFRLHGEQIPGKGRVSRRNPERKLLDSLTLEDRLFTMEVVFQVYSFYHCWLKPPQWAFTQLFLHPRSICVIFFSWFTFMINDQVKFKPIEPPHGRFASLSNTIKDLMPGYANVVAYFNAARINKGNSGWLSFAMSKVSA